MPSADMPEWEKALCGLPNTYDYEKDGPIDDTGWRHPALLNEAEIQAVKDAVDSDWHENEEEFNRHLGQSLCDAGARKMLLWSEKHIFTVLYKNERAWFALQAQMGISWTGDRYA